MDLDEVPENGEVTTTINFKPSFVIIAIDTHPSMFETKKNDDDTETHAFKDALEACYELADSLILSSSRSNYNQFGVVLADDDHKKASLVEVENNLLDSVKLLKRLSRLSNEELKAKYERQGDLDLGAFFLLCKKKFKAINSAYYKRTIVFVTNDDNPVEDKQKRFTALNEAKTFEAGDIHFELITMNTKFDYTKFYNELFHLYSKPPTTDDVCEDKDGLLEKFQTTVVFPFTKLRCNFYPFKNDFSKYLKVMRGNFIRKQKLYNTDKASPDGRLLKRVRPELGIEHAATNADYQLYMGPMEKQEHLNLEIMDKYDIYGNDLPLGFHLQYVSDRQSLPGVVISGTSLLMIDPKEELPYFEQFWQYCVDKNKALICIKKYKHPTTIRYVELIPKYANNQKLFLIKDLPFSHELRIPKAVKLAQPQQYSSCDKKKKLVRDLVNGLSFDYHQKMFINVSLGRKKAHIKAKLLNEPEEEVEDATADVTGIDEQIGEIVREIKWVFDISEPQGTKRKAPAGSGRGRGRGKKSAQ